MLNGTNAYSLNTDISIWAVLQIGRSFFLSSHKSASIKSERTCLYFAARNGINTNKSVLYTLAVPCSDCARGLIQAGVSKVYYHYQHNANFEFENPKWAESVKRSLEMFDESGVKCIGHNQWFGFSTLINGKNIEV